MIEVQNDKTGWCPNCKERGRHNREGQEPKIPHDNYYCPECEIHWVFDLATDAASL